MFLLDFIHFKRFQELFRILGLKYEENYYNYSATLLVSFSNASLKDFADGVVNVKRVEEL